jgi:hypothetical protein
VVLLLLQGFTLAAPAQTPVAAAPPAQTATEADRLKKVEEIKAAIKHARELIIDAAADYAKGDTPQDARLGTIATAYNAVTSANGRAIVAKCLQEALLITPEQLKLPVVPSAFYQGQAAGDDEAYRFKPAVETLPFAAAEGSYYAAEDELRKQAETAIASAPTYFDDSFEFPTAEYMWVFIAAAIRNRVAAFLNIQPRAHIFLWSQAKTDQWLMQHRPGDFDQRAAPWQAFGQEFEALLSKLLDPLILAALAPRDALGAIDAKRIDDLNRYCNVVWQACFAFFEIKYMADRANQLLSVVDEKPSKLVGAGRFLTAQMLGKWHAFYDFLEPAWRDRLTDVLADPNNLLFGVKQSKINERAATLKV